MRLEPGKVALVSHRQKYAGRVFRADRMLVLGRVHRFSRYFN